MEFPSVFDRRTVTKNRNECLQNAFVFKDRNFLDTERIYFQLCRAFDTYREIGFFNRQCIFETALIQPHQTVFIVVTHAESSKTEFQKCTEIKARNNTTDGTITAVVIRIIGNGK